MTSPSQLNYLNAMGIAVWVSRDQVIVDISSETQTGKNISAENKSSAQDIINHLNSANESSNQEDNQDANSSAKIVHQAYSKSENLLIHSEHHSIYACGDENADWMVIGHSPEPFIGIGEEPFAGEAGQLLDNMLRAVGLEQPRQDAYLFNILSNSQNRVSENFDEILISSIKKVQPKVLLIVGQNAAQTLLNCTDPLIIMRGKIHNILETNTPCVVTYYPDYLLQKPIDKRKAWDDLKLAMSVLN